MFLSQNCVTASVECVDLNINIFSVIYSLCIWCAKAFILRVQYLANCINAVSAT